MKLREYEKESKTLKGGKYANKRAGKRPRKASSPNPRIARNSDYFSS